MTNFVIIPTTSINQVNFAQTLDTGPDTCRFNIDKTKVFIKYAGEQIPASIQAISDHSPQYTLQEFLNTLQSSEWTPILNTPVGDS